MVRHIVMWNLKEENKEANAAEIKRALENLNGKIEVVSARPNKPMER